MPGVGGHQDDLDAHLDALADGSQHHGHRLRHRRTEQLVGVKQHGAEVHRVALRLQLGREFLREALRLGKAVHVRHHDQLDACPSEDLRGPLGGIAPRGRDDHLADAPQAGLFCRQPQGLVGVRRSRLLEIRDGPFHLVPPRSDMSMLSDSIRAVRRARLVRIGSPRLSLCRSRVAHREPQGKTVQVRRGAAAVTGDESRCCHCPQGWEGAAERTIREPEDLLVCSGLSGSSS